MGNLNHDIPINWKLEKHSPGGVLCQWHQQEWQ